jgi:hypothetical protein
VTFTITVCPFDGEWSGLKLGAPLYLYRTLPQLMTSLPVAVVAAFEIGSRIIKPWLGGVKLGGISAGLVQAAPEVEVNNPIEQLQSTSMSMGTVNQFQTSS